MLSDKTKANIVHWTLAAVAVAFILALASMIRLGLHIQRSGELSTEALDAAGAVRDQALAACQAENMLIQARIDRICDRVRVLEKIHGIETPSGARRQMRESE